MSARRTRRHFLREVAGAGLCCALPNRLTAVPFPVRFPKTLPYESLSGYIDPRRDGFETEKRAVEITEHLERLPQSRLLPLSSRFEGISPQPLRYRQVAEGIALAEFDPADRRFTAGLEQWLDQI